MSDMVFHVSDDAYDRFMGRYSTQLAPLFADAVGARGRVLDVGAGAGALTAELARRLGADGVAAAEPSEEFTSALATRLPDVEARTAPAEDLPWESETFDAVLAQLVISFVADPAAAISEMRRVARPGGTVALCMWHDDGLELSPPLMAARKAAAPADAPPPPKLPFRSEEELAALLSAAGLGDVRTTTLAVSSTYSGFDEFWDAAAGMLGPETAWMRGLDPERLAIGRDAAHRALGSPAGDFVLNARAAAAWALRV